jgi:RsiW-degrading membrane proteinase PrsW (M82 family)
MELKLKIFSKILIVLFSFFVNNFAFSAGLVPCGGPGEPVCDICHFFQLIHNVLYFFFKNIVLPVAVLVFVIGGLMFALYPEDPGKADQAKRLIFSAVIGLFIMFLAYMIVGLLLSTIGLGGWTKDFYKNWWEKGLFEIPCE